MMKIAFDISERNMFAKAIRWWTKKPQYHVELVFSDGLSYSASPKEWKTRFKQIDYSKEPQSWDIIELPISAEDEKKIREYCEKEKECWYDIIGIVFTEFIDLGFESPWWWFCSEICCAGLQQIGWFPDKKAYHVSPGDLNLMIKDKLIEYNYYKK